MCDLLCSLLRSLMELLHGLQRSLLHPCVEVSWSHARTFTGGRGSEILTPLKPLAHPERPTKIFCAQRRSSCAGCRGRGQDKSPAWGLCLLPHNRSHFMFYEIVLPEVSLLPVSRLDLAQQEPRQVRQLTNASNTLERKTQPLQPGGCFLKA